MIGETHVSSLIDIVIRTGFEQSFATLSELLTSFLGACRITRHALGSDFRDALDDARLGTAPFVLILDDVVSISRPLLVDALEALVREPHRFGATLHTPALADVYGSNDMLPSWFTLLRRETLQLVDNDWATPEYFLLGVAALAGEADLVPPGEREGLHFNSIAWARDLMKDAAPLLAADYARLRAADPARGTRIPPQLHVEAVGRFVDAPPLANPRRGTYPTFTVICPVFKPNFLAEMIASVQRQTWPNWEFVMRIDGPPEHDRRRIEAILAEHANDPRISYTFGPNAGTGPTREILAREARGDFLVSIDDDDELTPDCLERFASAIVRNPGVSFFRGGARIVGLVEREMRPRSRILVAGISADIFEVTQPFAIAVSALHALGGFEWDPALRNAGEDTILFQKIDRLRLETCIIDEPLYRRRLSHANLTLQFETHECMQHGVTVDRWSRPAEWMLVDYKDTLNGDFVQAASTYLRGDGRRVVTATRFFQYRAYGTLSGTTLDLELTSACNAVCTFCPRDEMPDTKRMLPIAVAERIADELRAQHFKPDVTFCGIGESTLHPQLLDITTLIAGTGSRVSMTSNGARLSPDLFRRLAEAGLSGLNVSLNAATPETHRALMKLPGFERITATIRELLALRAREYPWVNVHVSMVVCAENEHEADAFVAQWRESGVSRVWLHPVNNRAGLLSGIGRPVNLQHLAARYAGDPLVSVDVLQHRSEDSDLCKIAKTFNFVSADGRVRLCAMDYRRETEYGDLAEDALLTSHHRKLQAFQRGETHALCRTCDFYPAGCGGTRELALAAAAS